MTTHYRPENTRSREAREDVNLLKMALEQMWPVPQESKQEVVDRQLEIIRDPMVPAVVRTMAVKNLVAIGVCNIKTIEVLIRAGLAEAEKAPAPVVATDEEIERGLGNMLRLTTESSGSEQSPVVEIGEPLRHTG